MANQLLTSSDVTGQTDFLFDANGNQQVVKYPVNTLTTTTWNYENQPTVYEKPDTTRVTMTYNADNRRVSKASPSAKTNSLWDAESDNVLTETDGFGTTLAVYTNEPNQFGELVSQRRAGTTSWVYADALGSIWNLCDSSETITDSYLYDAWGNILSGTGSTANPFKYVGAYGYYFDMETGSNYVRARVYEPTIARWWSQDPIAFGESVFGSRDPIYSLVAHRWYAPGLRWFLGRDPLGLQVRTPGLYLYVKLSPLNHVDPLGLKTHVINGEITDVSYSGPGYRKDSTMAFTPRWISRANQTAPILEKLILHTTGLVPLTLIQ